MSRSIALVSIILAMSIDTPNAEAIRYVVDPVALSDGYAISGGFIETDTSGQLMDGDITDYLITVEGELPYIFSPNNPGASVVIRGIVLATDGQIIIPIVTPGGYPFPKNSLAFDARSYVPPDLTDGIQSVAFSSESNPVAWYTTRSYTNTEFRTCCEPHGLGERFEESDSLSRPIVVATVPEPSTVTLIFLGLCVFATRMKRKA